MYMAFIDLKKEFDIVPWEKLWEALADSYYKVDLNLLRVIHGPYTTSESVVRTSYGLSGWFLVRYQPWCQMGRGLVASSVLTLYGYRGRETVMKEQMGAVMVYADDTAMVAHDRRNTLFKALQSVANKCKTEMMKIADQKEDIDIELQGVRIKSETKYKYLGVRVNSGDEKLG